MTYKILWTPNAKEDLFYWQKKDKKTLKRIDSLIQSIKDNPFIGIGKPERLKYQDKNIWSRRITQMHRLVYYIEAEEKKVYINQCRYHY